MTILNDNQITSLCPSDPRKKMIDPFLDTQYDSPSFGLSSFGYDIRIGYQFKIFTNSRNAIIDPLDFKPSSFIDVHVEDFVIIPPNSFALGQSMEYFKIPEDVMTICVGKSTYARCGIITNVTPFEPGWEGIVTLEISNTSTLPAKVYAGRGIAQVIFFQGERPDVTYADRKGGGKYQGQTGITLAKT